MSRHVFYFTLTNTMSHSKYSWQREYLKVTMGAVFRLEKVTEFEDKTIYRPACPKFGIPFDVKVSTKLEYTKALLRFRKEEARLKRIKAQEKQAEHTMKESMAIARGFKPPRIKAQPVVGMDPATLFDDFTIVDTEYQHDVLLEVAAIRYKNWQPVEDYQSFVRYTGWVSPFTTQHTGIREADVRAAPTEKEVLQKLVQLAQGSLLIAHNVGADRSQLEKACERQRLQGTLPERWFCTMALARAREPKGMKCGLTDLCDRYRFGNTGAHRAMSDVRRTFLVLRHYHEVEPLRSLNPKDRTAAPTLFAA